MMLPDPMFIKANILIDKNGHVHLADSGFLTVLSDPVCLIVPSSYMMGSTT